METICCVAMIVCLIQLTTVRLRHVGFVKGNFFLGVAVASLSAASAGSTPMVGLN